MKIWNNFGSEHSANLVIIGRFSTGEKAKAASALLDEITRIARAEFEKHRGDSLSKPMLDAVLKHEVTNLSPSDCDSLGYDFHSTLEGDHLVIRTEESETQAFVKLLLHHGAKIELYSAHDHPGKYGR